MAKTIEELNKALGDYFPTLLRRAKDNNDIFIAMSNGFDAIERGSLSWARLNQIIHLCSEAGMSEGFYKYYFLALPDKHPYPVGKVFLDDDYKPPESSGEIKSLKQFLWGIRRFLYDAMIYWGNFRQAYRDLRQKTYEQIESLFTSKRINEALLLRRGKVVEPVAIPRDNRYLISEMACKTFERQTNTADAEHVRLALQAFREMKAEGKPITPDSLKQKTKNMADANKQIPLFELMFETPDKTIDSEEEVLALYSGQHQAFENARKVALQNTRTYLSICNDLDVYVATSMRTRDDFREMAQMCELIFNDERLEHYNLRYFDPTLSAANYHEDKGIIECLMVKTTKVLLYFAQHKESLGKVSEYAMALSLGKPVIILCPDDARGTEIYQFYRDQHPLIRLIEFSTGIVNGAIVTQKPEDVIILLERLFSNRMEYNLDRKSDTISYYLLKERLTQSTIRVVTDDQLLLGTFWNNYHQIF